MLQIVPLLSPVYLSQLQVELLPIRVSRILLWRLISNLGKTIYSIILRSRVGLVQKPTSRGWRDAGVYGYMRTPRCSTYLAAYANPRSQKCDKQCKIRPFQCLLVSKTCICVHISARVSVYKMGKMLATISCGSYLLASSSEPGNGLRRAASGSRLIRAGRWLGHGLVSRSGLLSRGSSPRRGRLLPALK